MAIVEELFESRVGDTEGVDPAIAVRIFRVTTDDRDNNPILDLIADENAKAEIGAAHPWNAVPSDIEAVRGKDKWRTPVFCRNHTRVQKLTHKTWIIAAIYEPTEIFSPDVLLPGWIMRGRTSSSTELLLETLPLASTGMQPRPMSTKAITVLGGHIGVGEELVDKQKIIGPYYYEIAKDGQDHTHVALDGAKEIKLIQTKRRKQIGYQRTRPAMAFTLDKDVPNLPENWGGIIASYKGGVNQAWWLGADPGYIRFEDGAGEPTQGTLAGQLFPGLYWHVQLAFLWAAVPHEPLTLTHTFPDDLGNVLMVGMKGTGAKVTEDFHVANGKNFNDLLRKF